MHFSTLIISVRLKITTYWLNCIFEFEYVGIFEGKVLSFNSVKLIKLWSGCLEIISNKYIFMNCLILLGLILIR